MKSDILVSVIIPCYNVEKYIDECIDSVINQSYKQLEIICVDNNSSDNTLHKLKQAKERYPKIIILEEYSQGAPYARNRGVSIARGEWIQFLDADDILLPEKIAHQIEMLEECNDISFIVASYSMKNINTPNKDIMITEETPFVELFESRLGHTCSNLFSKKMIDSVGGWRVGLSSSQETNLMFEILKINNRLLFDKEIYTIIRQRDYGQISQSDPLKRWTIYIELRINILNYLKEYQSHIYTSNSGKIFNALFEALRVLAKHDHKRAIEYFHSFLPKGYIPIESKATTKRYIYLFRIFGFSNSEYIVAMISRYKKAINK